MVQHLAKATLVSCDSASFTKAVGTLYLFSFLLIGGCLLRARTPLTFELKATELLRKWGRVERVLHNEWSLLTRGTKRGILLEPVPANLWPSAFDSIYIGFVDAAAVWVVVSSITNFFLCCSILNFSPLALGKLLC
jgi:hypothetical protein